MGRFARLRDKVWAQPSYVKLLAEDHLTLRAMGRVDSDPPRKRELGSYVIHDPRAAEYHVDFTPRTKAVLSPVLVIARDQDHAIGPEHYRLFQFPHQTVQHIDGSHLLYYENSEVFVATIRAWIEATEAAGKRGSKHQPVVGRLAEAERWS